MCLYLPPPTRGEKVGLASWRQKIHGVYIYFRLFFAAILVASIVFYTTGLGRLLLRRGCASALKRCNCVLFWFSTLYLGGS